MRKLVLIYLYLIAAVFLAVPRAAASSGSRDCDAGGPGAASCSVTSDDGGSCFVQCGVHDGDACCRDEPLFCTCI
jgi:hypothetical protein